MSPRRRRPADPARQLSLDAPASRLPRTAWTGPFQPALERRWLEALGVVRRADPLAALWLLVPSRFLGLHLSRLAARAGGVVNLHVLTFTDLAERVLQQGIESRPLPPSSPPGGHAHLPPGAPTRRLPPVGDVLVLRQALREAVPGDGYFAAVREARRFPAALAATLAELRTAGVRPEDLERAAEAVGETASARKLREVARIARHAEATLAAAGFHRPTDALWAAADAAAQGTAAPDCAALMVYGFVEWNAAERALLLATANRLPTACFVPAEPGPPFEPLRELLDWLVAEGFRVEAAEGATGDGPRGFVTRLFHAPARPETPPARGRPEAAGLEVVAAPGEEREVREIARRILKAAAEGVPFETMGILVRHPEAYRSAFRDVFAGAGIPYTWGVAPRVGDTRAGRSLRLLLAARQEEFTRSAVIEFLATADLRDADGVEPAAWDRLSREAGIVGGREEWRRRLTWLARRAEEARAAADSATSDAEGTSPALLPIVAIQALGRAVGVLLDIVGRLPEQGTAAGLARTLLRAFERLCRRGGESQQVSGLLAALEDLAPLGAPLTLEEFGDLLDAALTAPAEPGPEPRQGKVFVGELHQALGLPFRLLFIPGLVEQGFPAPPRADPILLDEERRRLHAQVAGGRPGLTLVARRPGEERLAFRLACAAAEERLVLTYPRLDTQSGRARVPSFFLLRVAEAVTGAPYDFSRLEEGFPPHLRIPLVPAPPHAVSAPLDRREWLLAQATRGRAAGSAGRAACLALLPRATQGRAALEAREQGVRVSAWDGLLPEATRDLCAAYHRPIEAAVAATPLETYATCPFRYYLAHVLRIAPPTEPERVKTLPPVDRGRLVHIALAETYLSCRDAGLLPLAPERVAEARARLEEAFARAEERFRATGLAPFWRGERARLLADLAAALDAEAREAPAAAAWRPVAFEAGFGAGETEPTVAYPLGGRRTVHFRGRIDRLDLSPDGARARVIDYKAGRRRGPAGKRLAGGTALQLPVYRLAAEALCRAAGSPARVEEAQYYFLTRQGRRARVRFTDEDWAARRGDFDRILETILDGIAAGWFFQNPSAEVCRWCDYQAACGTERERIAWVARKRGDPARGPYQRLEEIE